MKKVAIVISHIPNPRILKRVKALENDFNITLIYWDRGQKEKESFEIDAKHNVIKINLNAPQGNPAKRIVPLIKYTVKVIKVLKNKKPTIIHAANMDMLMIAVMYKQIYNKKTKIVYEVADLPKYSFIQKTDSLKSFIARILQVIEKKMTTKISKIVLSSPYFWDNYFSRFIDKDKYLFIPNAPSKKLFNKYVKKNKDIFTIGYIGSIRYVDQLKMLIDAVDELRNNIEVFIAGSGPGYKEIFEYSKGKDFVKIYGPYNYEKEIVNLYEKVDCTYSVYNVELENVKIALPNRLYESIVCEIPIIGAKGTKLGKFIEEKEIGVSINYNDKEELKKQLVEMASYEEKLNVYQENCKRIKENYYYENNSGKFLSEYKKI